MSVVRTVFRAGSTTETVPSSIGYQELWSDVVKTKRIVRPHIPEIVAEIIAGVVQDGGGWIIINGNFIRVPPRGPVFEALEALAAEAEQLDARAAEQHGGAAP